MPKPNASLSSESRSMLIGTTTGASWSVIDFCILVSWTLRSIMSLNCSCEVRVSSTGPNIGSALDAAAMNDTMPPHTKNGMVGRPGTSPSTHISPAPT